MWSGLKICLTIKWIKTQYALITLSLSKEFISEIQQNEKSFLTKYVTIMIVSLTKFVHVFNLPNTKGVVYFTYMFCAGFDQKKKQMACIKAYAF